MLNGSRRIDRVQTDNDGVRLGIDLRDLMDTIEKKAGRAAGWTLATMQPWRCKHGHVLGIAKTLGNGKRVLILFRAPVNARTAGEWATAEWKPDRKVRETATIRCSVCGARRKWFGDPATQPGEGAAPKVHT